MKRIYSVLSMLLLLLLLLLGACSKQGPEEVPEKAVTKLTGDISLRLASFLPPMVPHISLYKEWAEKIETGTGGTVHIKVFPVGLLLGEEDMIEGVKTGIADMGDTITAIYENQFPLNNILMMPCMYMGNSDTFYRIKQELDDKFPEMKQESEQFKVLFINCNVVCEQIHTAERPVRLPEDLKGLKLYATGMCADLISSMGASPMSLPLSEWHMSLERGLFDGMFMDANGVFSTNCHSLLPNHTVFPSGFNAGTQQMIMTADTWNSLPDAAQKIIDDLALSMYNGLKEINDNANALALSSFKLKKQNMIVLTPEEEKVWKEAVLALHEAYLDKVEAMNLPARKIYKEALRLAEKYK